MTQYEIYTFILCALVIVLLTTLAVVMISVIVKQAIRLIRHGAEDEAIKKEYEKAQKTARKHNFGDCILSVILCVLLLGFFAFSIYVNVSENTYFEDIPTLKVVKTGSMAQKHEENEYLSENGLDDQIQTFDLILTYKIPKENDLQLYDIVMYEVDGVYIIHRIVGIEEPNARHPNERHFLLQGDAVSTPDRFPVLYSQMRAIYRGERIPFLGSFVAFMQSPVGWICMVLIVIAMIATPIIDKKLAAERAKRLKLMQAQACKTAASAMPALRMTSPVVVYPVFTPYDPRVQNVPPTPYMGTPHTATNRQQPQPQPKKKK